MIMCIARIQYVSGSNLGSNTKYTKVIVAVSLRPPRELPGAFLNLAISTSFSTISNSLFTNNSRFDATKSDHNFEKNYI
jgi:hypothetical protein